MLRAVVFDLDDTLIDWSGCRAGWTEVTIEHIRPVYDYLLTQDPFLPPIETVIETYSILIDQSWRGAYLRDWDAPRQEDILRQTLTSLGLERERLDMDHLQRLFAWGLMPGVRAFADTEHVLRTLYDSGLQIGLLTNAAQPMWMRDRELDELGIRPYFHFRTTAGDVGKMKPHPAAFQAVLSGLGVPSEEAVYVGDRPYDDVAGAQSAGMRAIFIRRNGTTLPEGIKPNAIIYRLSDMFTVFDLWYPAWRKAL